MRKSLITLILSCVVLLAFGQFKPDRRFINNFYDAEAFMYENNYGEALKLLDDLYSTDPDNANIQFKLGFCYLKSRTMQKRAAEYLEYASEYVSEKYDADNHRERNTPISTYFYLGQAYRINHDFEKSIEAFNTYKSYMDPDDRNDTTNIKETDRQIEITNRARHMTRNPNDATIVNLGPNINSEFIDHTPTIDINESKMVFTSKRPKPEESLYNQDEDLFISKNHNYIWSEPERLTESINTEENEATISLSSDGRHLFFFRSAYGTGNIFSTQSNGETWSKPEILTEMVNSKARETHACLSPDGNSIYFTSTRKDGDKTADIDIYVLRRLPNMKWSEPKKLGDNINTPYDEETPFMHPDGKTLFFSSKGHETMGGYDIFYAKMKDDYTFTEPVNLGYPINTTGDDVSYVLSLDGRRGYVVSASQEEGYGDLDIYQVNQANVYINDMAVYHGEVSDLQGRTPQDVKIKARDRSTNNVNAVFRPDEVEGNYLMILEPGKTFDLEYEVKDRLLYTSSITPTKEDVEKFSEEYKPVSINPVKLKTYTYYAEVVFDTESTEILPNAYDVITKVSRTSDTVENMYVTILYPPANPLSIPRSDKIKEHILDLGFAYDHISVQGKTPPEAEKVYAINIEETEKPVATWTQDESTEVSEEYAEKTVVKNIFFGFDSDQIRSKYFDNLNTLADYMRNNDNAVIEIAGHTDAIGSNEYNYLLSYRRAKSVKDYLVNKGADQGSLITKKYGESEPVASNRQQGRDNPIGRRYNRRVQFNLIQQGEHGQLFVQPINPKTTPLPAVSSKSGSKYTIQVCALKNNKRCADSFNDLIGVKEHIGSDGYYRYYVGEFGSWSEAEQSMQNLRDMGYDAFIRRLSFFE